VIEYLLSNLEALSLNPSTMKGRKEGRAGGRKKERKGGRIKKSRKKSRQTHKRGNKYPSS
jgi:hypothetical protein